MGRAAHLGPVVSHLIYFRFETGYLPLKRISFRTVFCPFLHLVVALLLWPPSDAECSRLAANLGRGVVHSDRGRASAWGQNQP